MSERTQTADLLKGIAALLMIQVHIIELFATKSVFESNAGKFLLFLGGPPVASVFLAIFGYFIATSSKTIKQQVIRGVKIIVLGLILNLALNFNLILSVLKGKYFTDIMPYILGADILPNAGLSLILIAFLPKMVKNNPLLLILLSVVVVFAGEWLLNNAVVSKQYSYILAFVYGAEKWSYFPLLPWFAYSLMGMAFFKITQTYDFSILNSVVGKIVMTLIFGVFITLSFSYAVSVSADLQTYYHHGIAFFCWTVSFLLFYSFIIKTIASIIPKNSIATYLQWLGQNITAIYVVQWILIGNIATEIYQSVSSPLILFSCFLLITAVSTIFVYWWKKINYKKASPL